MVDTLGLYLAGGLEHSVQMLARDAVETGGREDAFIIAAGRKNADQIIAMVSTKATLTEEQIALIRAAEASQEADAQPEEDQSLQQEEA